MNQINSIYNLLETGHTLTGAGAFVKYGILNLPSHIKALKKRGVPIQTVYKDLDDETRVACYFLNEYNEDTFYWPHKTTTFQRMQGETKVNAFLRFMIEYNGITTIQAYSELYAIRPSSIIYALRKKNYDIKTEMISIPGRKHKIAKYTLI